MTNLKRHLTVANVLSCMALFVALGGTAYAAAKLTPNQVKAVNIAKQAVTNAENQDPGGHLRENQERRRRQPPTSATGAVTGSKLAKEARSPAASSGEEGRHRQARQELGPTRDRSNRHAGKIDNEAITSAKISAAVWKQLLKNVTYVTRNQRQQLRTTKRRITATCPTGKEAIGGGARINSPASVKVAVERHLPRRQPRTTPAPAGSRPAARPAEEAGNWPIVAYAVCAEL